MPPTDADFHRVIDAVHRTGHVVSSESTALPEPILEGHPIHSAVARLERSYPGGLLPPRGRLQWRRVLRCSRRRDEGLFEVIDAFLDWLDDELDRDGQGGSEADDEDGLKESGFRLVWQGVAYDLQPQVWRTLRYFWTRAVVSQGDFEEHLWGDVAEPATVRRAIYRANKALKRSVVPWRLALRNGQVAKTTP